MKLIFLASFCVLAFHGINALTVPRCLPNAKGCCNLGNGIKMRNPGMILIESKREFEGTVTCYNGELKCFSGLPKYRSSLEGQQLTKCPDFNKLGLTGTNLRRF